MLTKIRPCAAADPKAGIQKIFTAARRLFPPQTGEGQSDEKWSFAGKKEKNCSPDDPADDRPGDSWDHAAYDPGHRLVSAAVPGKRTAGNAEKAAGEFQKRTDGSRIILITGDEYKPYKTDVLNIYGKETVPARTGKQGALQNLIWNRRKISVMPLFIKPVGTAGWQKLNSERFSELMRVSERRRRNRQ